MAFHKGRFLKDGRISERLSFDYADFLAGFSVRFDFLNDSEREQCLQLGPIPHSYGPSPIHFCTPDRVASFTEAFVARAEPTLPAFGQLSSSIRAVARCTKSPSLLRTMKLRLVTSQLAHEAVDSTTELNAKNRSNF